MVGGERNVQKTSAPASYSSLSIEERGACAHPLFGGSFSSPKGQGAFAALPVDRHIVLHLAGGWSPGLGSSLWFRETALLILRRGSHLERGGGRFRRSVPRNAWLESGLPGNGRPQ